MTVEKKTIRAHCNLCVGLTNHLVLHKDSTSWDGGDEQYQISGGDEYLLIRCAGCDTVHLQHDSWFSEDCDEDVQIVRTRYYPPAISRRRPDWLKDPEGPFYFGST